MNETTRAEKLAQDIDKAWLENTFCTVEDLQKELRRLSPMEAEQDKLLEINKVLADALTFMVHVFKGTDAHYSPAIKAVSDANKALKLAGEII